ncbi:hypothetical protein OSTOST_20222, partial [Ostertagia ostertagi]
RCNRINSDVNLPLLHHHVSFLRHHQGNPCLFNLKLHLNLNRICLNNLNHFGREPGAHLFDLLHLHHSNLNSKTSTSNSRFKHHRHKFSSLSKIDSPHSSHNNLNSKLNDHSSSHNSSKHLHRLHLHPNCHLQANKICELE